MFDALIQKSPEQRLEELAKEYQKGIPSQQVSRCLGINEKKVRNVLREIRVSLPTDNLPIYKTKLLATEIKGFVAAVFSKPGMHRGKLPLRPQNSDISKKREEYTKAIGIEEIREILRKDGIPTGDLLRVWNQLISNNPVGVIHNPSTGRRRILPEYIDEMIILYKQYVSKNPIREYIHNRTPKVPLEVQYKKYLNR